MLLIDSIIPSDITLTCSGGALCGDTGTNEC